MALLETAPKSRKTRYFRGFMNARWVANLVGTKHGTLNSWIARGHIPGLSVGPSGKRRDIDADTAVLVSVFAELLRMGVPPDRAAGLIQAMKENGFDGGWVIVPQPHDAAAIILQPRGLDLGQTFRNLEVAPTAPSIWVAINVARIAARVAAAEQEWLASREAKS